MTIIQTFWYLQHVSLLFLAASSSSRSLVVRPSLDFVKKLTLLDYKRTILYFTMIEVTVVTVVSVVTEVTVVTVMTVVTVVSDQNTFFLPKNLFPQKLFSQKNFFHKKTFFTKM